jgi:hypothetical protein
VVRNNRYFRTKEKRMRYHLNIRHGTEITLDEEGEELTDLEAARRSARTSVRALVADDLLGGRPVARRDIDVSDANGTTVASVGISVTES